MKKHPGYRLQAAGCLAGAALWMTAAIAHGQVADGQEPNRGAALDLASQDPKVALSRIKVAEGYEVSLFASEVEFPDLAKPLSMTFDTRGRLWVLTSPTYPHVLPDEKPNDKLIVLEDTNRDGKADKCTVFADKLYIPTGFALGDGGVYIAQQPTLMFIKDTNGDGKADERRDPPARLRHRGQPSLDPRLAVGPRRRALLPGGHVPALAGRDAVRPASPRVRRRVALRAAHREARRLRVVSLREPVGARDRRVGPELRLRRVQWLQLLGHGVLRARRLPEQAEVDAGVDADTRAADERQRVRQEPALPRVRAGQLPLQQRHRLPRHQAVQDRRGGLRLRRRRSRAVAAVHRPELPSGRHAVRTRRRALRDRLVQPADRPHAVLDSRSTPRQVAWPRVAHHGQGPAAADAAEDRRRDDRRATRPPEGVRGPHPLPGPARTTRMADGAGDPGCREVDRRARQGRPRLRTSPARGALGARAQRPRQPATAGTGARAPGSSGPARRPCASCSTGSIASTMGWGCWHGR